jgi:KaiC/GvpD/RAD55 family RecA-like ATPase
MPEDASVFPLVGPLLRGPVPDGTSFVILFDPDSQWSTLAAAWIVAVARTRPETLFVSTSRPLPRVREEMGRMGAPIAEWEAKERLVLSDGFTHKTGHRSSERVHFASFNPGDVSIASEEAASLWDPGLTYVFENMSEVVAATDEQTFLKFYQRWTARLVSLGRVTIEGFVRGVHSESFVNSLVAGAHCVIELRVEEIGNELVDTLRVRTFRGRRADTRRHVVRFDDTLRPSLTPMGQPTPI